MKKVFSILFLIIILTFVFLGSFSFAAERPLEVEYPKIGEYEITETTTSLPEYIRYIYFAAIGISGLIALVVLIYAGFIYFTSTGNPEKIKDAKERIAAAFIGLIILFFSYLIVNAINPQLTLLRVTPLEVFVPELPTGVFLCTKEVDFKKAWNLIRNYETADSEARKQIKKDLQPMLAGINNHCSQEATSYGDYTPEFFKKVEYVYLVPLIEGVKYEEYGAILYEKPGHKGKTKIVYEHWRGGAVGPTEAKITPEISKLSSIITFRFKPPDEYTKGACLYEHQNYNKDTLGKGPCFPFEWSDWIVGPIGLSFPPQSIEIKGEVIAILGKGEEYAVFVADDPNLLDNEAITKTECDPLWYLFWRECVTLPVADSLQLISGSIYMW